MILVSDKDGRSDRAQNMAFSRWMSTCILTLVLVTLGTGCQTGEKKKKAKEASLLRLHLEGNPDGTPHNIDVPVYRANPVMITINREAFLDPSLFSSAELVDVDQVGGFAIKITCDPAGKFRLENTTTANKGRRIAVFAHWTESRWLAAPRISQPLRDGVFIFTPDATRAEAERIVNGLNNVIKNLKKPYIF